MIPINVEIGLKINDKIEYIPLGIFNIDNVKKNDFTIKITAYDNMSKFKIPYFSSLGNLATLAQVVNEIAAKTGVQFEGSLPSYSVKKLEGFSCREVLGFVASLCGGNAIIKRNGKFTIIYPTDINRYIGEGYFDFSREEVKYKIGKITCKSEDRVLSKGSLGADSMELEFENPWATDSILNDIYNRLNGFEYLGYDLKWQGDPSLDIGDIITHKDDKGVIRKLPILNYKLSYDGGLDSELSAKGETKNKNSFDSSGSMKKKIDRVVTELAIVNEALIDVAYIGDLTANNIKFDTASGGTLDLQSLLVKFVSGENGQYLNLTSSNVVIDNAVIKDAMIENVSLNKLKAGTINTNTINLASADGGLSIAGPTMQFKDKSNRVRLQLGQDTAGDFNFILRAADGTTTLIDGYGIKEKAIADKLIKSNMVADNAIGEQQINYSSLVTGLNKDTNTSLIQASKVAIDLTGQKLDVAFDSLKSTVNDTKSKTESNITSIGIINGQIDTLIKDTTIIEDGTTVKLKDSYSTLKQTVDGINTTVASHTTSITNLGTNITNAQNTANNANTLADSKAKVFTSTPTTPYKTGDIWTGGPSGEIMKCKVARATGSYVATDWEKASKYTDDTKANAVEVNLNNLSGKVTTVETKQATLEQNIEGFKTTVSSTYSTKTELNTLNDTVTAVEQKVNTVEQNITATAIITTISSAINAGTSSITTTQFIMDKNGLAIKNGALTIKNKAGATVLSSDTNGNLTVTGTITGSKIVGSDITGGTINGSTIISEGLVNKRELFIEASGGYSPQITFRPLIKNQDGTGTLKNKAYLYASASGLHIQAVEDGDIIIEANRLLFFGGYSINTNGYSKLPNGLILQWGVFTTPGINANAEITPTITIPIAFPNRMLIVMPYVRKSVNASGGTVNVEVAIKQVTHYTLSTFAPRLLAKAYVEGGVELGYIAIGY
jgi:hypothetical protein